jgi:hypothetical protein
MSYISSFYDKLKNGSGGSGVKVNHMFRLSITGAPAGLAARFNDANDDYMIMAQTATLPETESEFQPVHFRGIEFSVPVNVKFSKSMDIEFICDAGMNVKHDLDAWVNSIANIANDTAGTKGEVPNANIILDLIDENDSTKVVRSYVLVGAFPTKTGTVALAQNGTDIIRLGTSWQYQYWYESEQLFDPLNGSLIEDIIEAIRGII